MLCIILLFLYYVSLYHKHVVSIVLHCDNVSLYHKHVGFHYVACVMFDCRIIVLCCGVVRYVLSYYITLYCGSLRSLCVVKLCWVVILVVRAILY